MSVSVVLFTTVGHEPGLEAWCDVCGSVAELTVPLSDCDEDVDEASASVERAALLHEDNDHSSIGWDDDEPVLLRTLPVGQPERTTGQPCRPTGPSWSLLMPRGSPFGPGEGVVRQNLRALPPGARLG